MSDRLHLAGCYLALAAVAVVGAGVTWLEATRPTGAVAHQPPQFSATAALDVESRVVRVEVAGPGWTFRTNLPLVVRYPIDGSK